MLMVVPSRSMNLDPGTKPLATTGSAQRAAGRPRFPKPEDKLLEWRRTRLLMLKRLRCSRTEACKEGLSIL